MVQPYHTVTEILNFIQCSMVNNVNSKYPFKIRIANEYPNLIARIGRSKIHIVKSKFCKCFQSKLHLCY